MVLPACALDGDGVTVAGGRMGWHAGPTLLGVLETIRVEAAPVRGFRMAVQWVSRVGERRLYAGSVAAGRIAVGEAVALSDGGGSVVSGILGPGGAQGSAFGGRGCGAGAGGCAGYRAGERDFRGGCDPAAVADQFQAHLVWCDAKRR